MALQQWKLDRKQPNFCKAKSEGWVGFCCHSWPLTWAIGILGWASWGFSHMYKLTQHVYICVHASRAGARFCRPAVQMAVGASNWNINNIWELLSGNYDDIRETPARVHTATTDSTTGTTNDIETWTIQLGTLYNYVMQQLEQTQLWMELLKRNYNYWELWTTTTENITAPETTLMKKSYVSLLISVVKLELAAQNILKMMDTG